MDSKRSKYIALSVFLALIIIVSSIVFIMRLKTTKTTTKKYFDPVIINNITRGNILDCNEEILALDQPVNYVVFNTDYLQDLTDDEKDSIYKKISEQFLISSFKEKIKDYQGVDIGIKSGFDAIEKQNLKTKLKKIGLDNYLSIQEENMRVYNQRTSESLKKFLGKVNESTREGVSGIEKIYNDVLKSKVGLAEPGKEGHNIHLSLDLPLIEILDKITSEQKSNCTAIVFNIKNSLLAGISTNIEGDEKLSTYLLPSLDNVNIFSAYKILSMIECDPTLLEPYYCTGQGGCKTSHGPVALSNWINCKGAIQANMQNYNNELLYDNFFSYLDSGALEKTDASILTLMFLAYNPNYVPTCKYINGAFLKNIEGVNEEIDDKNDFYSVKLSSKGLSYIRDILNNNICKEFVSFSVNNTYYVLLYQNNGIKDDFIHTIKKDLNNYSMLQKENF